jgi:hypothetical protein
MIHLICRVIVATGSLFFIVYNLYSKRYVSWIRKAYMVTGIAGLAYASLAVPHAHTRLMAARLSQGDSILAGFVFGILLTIYISGAWREHPTKDPLAKRF